MKRNNAMIKRAIQEAIRGAIGGAFMMALIALIVDPELLLSLVIWGTIGGAVFGVVLGLGTDSLWTRIAGINSMIIVVTFAGVFLALPITFAEVGWVMLIIIIAGFGMAFVTSFIVTRPLRILSESTQAIGKQNLSERVPVKGAREIRPWHSRLTAWLRHCKKPNPAANK